MDGGEGTDRDPVVLVDDLVHALVVELVDLGVVAPEVDKPGTAREIPGVHLLHLLDGVLGAEFRNRAAGTPDSQGQYPPHERAADEQLPDGTEVIAVQVADEDLVR